MAQLDNATRRLAGRTIWEVAVWLEAHDSGEPYEIFAEPLNDGHEFGYRLTVERIESPRLPRSLDG